MSERYPDDASLLAMNQDPTTGVELIPTGQSPYYLAFRRLVQRTLLAAQRANDLRVYQQGDRTLGVRPGRYTLGTQSLEFAGIENLELPVNSTTWLWIESDAQIHLGSSLPTTPGQALPLAVAVTGSQAIVSLSDRRGQTFLLRPTLATLGLSSTPETINRLTDGLDATATAESINRITGGPHSDASNDHSHQVQSQSVDGMAYFTFSNDSEEPGSGAALALSLPYLMGDSLILKMDTTHGFLIQSYEGLDYHALGVAHAMLPLAGTIGASITGRLIGAVPASGQVTDIFLSLGTNLQSSQSTDGITATVKVNGTTLTTTSPKLTSAAGAGFRSTARGQGTAGVIKTDGTANVQRGDLLTLDLTRSVSGTISSEAADAVVLVIIRVSAPE